VIDEAVKRGVWLEVNASPERLDLSANHVRSAKARGAKFIVSTDAHHPKHLLNMRFGVTTARRGGLSAEDVMNTLPYDSFIAALRNGH
jgi:DNA polymerase (family 10)